MSSLRTSRLQSMTDSLQAGESYWQRKFFQDKALHAWVWYVCWASFAQNIFSKYKMGEG